MFRYLASSARTLLSPVFNPPAMSYCNGESTDGSDRIIWIDMEMTGLDVEKCQILEVASVVTDKNLKIIAKGPEIVLHQPKEILDGMDDWCKQNHGCTGLTEDCLKSGVTVAQAEDQLLSFFREHTPPGMCPLAGNTVYMDKIFMMKYFPRVCEHLHYRLIDVSTIKELSRRWYPEVWERVVQSKEVKHRAMSDILASIEELRQYRTGIFASRPDVENTF